MTTALACPACGGRELISAAVLDLQAQEDGTAVVVGSPRIKIEGTDRWLVCHSGACSWRGLYADAISGRKQPRTSIPGR